MNKFWVFDQREATSFVEQFHWEGIPFKMSFRTATWEFQVSKRYATEVNAIIDAVAEGGNGQRRRAQMS